MRRPAGLSLVFWCGLCGWVLSCFIGCGGSALSVDAATGSGGTTLGAAGGTGNGGNSGGAGGFVPVNGVEAGGAPNADSAIDVSLDASTGWGGAGGMQATGGWFGADVAFATGGAAGATVSGATGGVGGSPVDAYPEDRGEVAGAGGITPVSGGAGAGGRTGAGGSRGSDGDSAVEDGRADIQDVNSIGLVDGGSEDKDGATDGAVDAGPALRLIAGALGGSGKQDGIGPAAGFYAPAGAASDRAGHLFVADQFNQTIRKVVIDTGAVTTVAGLAGTVGSSDGVASAARFSSPYGVAYDGAGALWIADTNNQAIRRLDIATGAVTTLAGSVGSSGTADGTGSAARFHYPAGIASDGAGSLFVADTSNHAIRRIDIATAAVTTLAGAAGSAGSADGTGSAARFNYPEGLAADGAGHVFVADTSNHTLRKIDVATGAVTTVAGSAGSTGTVDGTGTAARLNFPIGLSSDGVGGLFFADSNNHTIRRFDVTTLAITTLAGLPGSSGSADGTGTTARFANPSGVATDGAGNLLVADSSNNEIRKLRIATGTVTTLAGMVRHQGTSDGIGGAARFNSPTRGARDGMGNLFIVDTGNSTIRKLVIGSGAVTTFAGSVGATGNVDGTGTGAEFSLPRGLASDGAGNLFVADTSNSTIRKIVLSTASVTTLAGSPGNYGTADGTGAAARFHFPTDLAVDGAGNLFVADTNNHTVRKLVIATGEVTTLAGSAGTAGSLDGVGSAAQFNAPYGVASDGVGNILVADTSNNTIRKIVVATGEVSTFVGTAGSAGCVDGVGGSARFDRPYALATDGRGGLFVADINNHMVRRVDLATKAVVTVVGTVGNSRVLPGPLPAGLDFPSGLIFEPAVGLFIIDYLENAVLLAEL